MIAINPAITTNAAGTFSVSLDGLMQGMAMDDPAVRNQLTGGQLAQTETLPMFGGIPIAENIPPAVVLPARQMDSSLGMLITRATTGAVAGGGPTLATTMTGISVFNQNHAAINSPQSPVPQVDPGMLVNYYRFGSRARIAFMMDPAFNPATAGLTGPALSWVAASGWISNAGGIALPATTRIVGYNLGNSMTVLYNALTGFCTWVRNGNAILLEI